MFVLKKLRLDNHELSRVMAETSVNGAKDRYR